MRLRNEPTPHRAKFERVTEDGSEFFRVTCRSSGAVAKFWPSYLRDGDRLAIWEKEPPPGHEGCYSADHVNEAKL